MAERKSITVELKADKEGAFRATFATLNVVDHDGDVTVPGAFAKEPVRVAQFGHNWGEYIIGDGSIDSDDEKAWADAEFYLDTTKGLDTYRSVKRASAKGLQEWSYGFDVLKFSFGEFEGRQVRFLEQLKVHEVSPVMLGAGVGTGTDFVKAAGLPYADHFDRVLAEVKAFTARSGELASLRASDRGKEGRVLSAANRTRLASLLEAMRGAITDLDKLLRDTEPDDASGKALLHQLRVEFLRTQARLIGASS